MPKDLLTQYPGIRYLEAKAQKRMPGFSWEYLDQGTGTDRAKDRNVERLNEVLFTPEFAKGPLSPRTSTEVFGVTYSLPVGIAPVGLSGLLWPNSDRALAQTAATRRIPHVLSTVGTGSIEEIGPMARGMGWFQLYPPREAGLRTELIARVADAGFTTLVVTADVPAASRRERQTRAQLTLPPKIGPRLVAQSVLRPAWSLSILRNGLPRFRALEAHMDSTTLADAAGFVGAHLGGTFDWDYLRDLRQIWDGPLVVKGILHGADAELAVEAGADGVVVSNHGGRQLDAAPAAIDTLPSVVSAVGDATTVMFDSGIRGGLDVARAMAFGAQFCFCGRAYMFGLGALGDVGPDHVTTLIELELLSVMHQLGIESLDQLADRNPHFAT